MLKFIPPGSFDFGDEAVALIRSSSRGLRGEDRRGLAKRASDGLVDAFRNVEIRPGEVPIHLIALGATHKYGCNRNFDGFPEETCRRDHGSFVKHAMWYREHKNDDPAKSWGRVAYSHYNEPLARIELIVALNGTKEAAARNGGLVAEEELEKLAKGDDIAVSMATVIPYDVCSGCSNKARVKAEYCDADRCTKYGGLKRNLGRTYVDGTTLHMSNEINKWKDISKVKRGADRTAYVLGRLEKAASAAADDLWPPGPVVEAAWIPELYASPRIAAQAKAAAALEAACRRPAPPERLLAFSAGRDVSNLREKAASVLSASASLRATLDLASFLALISGDPSQAKAAAAMAAPFVPGAYAELLAEGEAGFASNAFAAAPATSVAPAWAKEALDAGILDKRAVSRRAAEAAIRGRSANLSRLSPVGRGPSPAVAGIARQYAMYKVATLSSLVDDPEFESLAASAAAQDLAAIAGACEQRFAQGPAGR